MNDHVARMLSDAQDRLNDADILAESGRAALDSAALLRILALEVLLKAAQLAALGKYKRSHEYSVLWDALPPATKAIVLSVAKQRFPGYADFSNLDALLKDWEYVFTKGRYYFELYEGYTLQQQRELGELWVSLGAPEEEAEVRFHPFELQALAEGLVAYVKNAP
jgi:HEPN domain-containing protein